MDDLLCNLYLTDDSRRLSSFLVSRLRRVAALASDPHLLSSSQLYLARHATLSCFRDCAAAGLRDEALKVLAGLDLS